MRFFHALTISFLCSCLCFSTVIADDQNSKIYISKDAVEFIDEGVLVHFNEVDAAFETLHADDDGLYVYKFEKISYYCPICKREVSNFHRCPLIDDPYARIPSRKRNR